MYLHESSTGGFPISTQRPLAVPPPKSSSRAFALAAAELAANTRCENVVLLDLRGRSPVTDYFLIATGTSPRQMRTVADEIADLGKKMGYAAWNMNGYDSARWIVLDCVHVVAHLFDSDSRDFYDLELLWGDSPRVDWRKELGLPPAPPEERTPGLREFFADAAGMDAMDAEEEEARLEGKKTVEEGDADVDEDADLESPIEIELPDESTGSNSVEMVEIDPPAKRRQRGRAVYPTPIAEPEDETMEEQAMGPLNTTDAAAVDETSVVPTEPETPEVDNRAEIPESHEVAAEAIRVGNVEMTTEEPSQRPRKRALHTRADEHAPTQAAPGPVNPRKAKAGVVKARASVKKHATKKPATRKAAPKKKLVAKKTKTVTRAAAKPLKKATPKKR